MSDLVRIRFALDRDADGWPPAESEGLWAEPIDGGGFRLDNTPWFVRGVAARDVVDAEPDGDGVLWFQRVRERGGRIVVRIIPRRYGQLRGDAQAVRDAFSGSGYPARSLQAR